MPCYRVKIYVPRVIDRILVAPLLLLRWVWYGYTFRRIRLRNFKKCAIVDTKDFHEFSQYIWWCRRPDVAAGAVRIAFKKGVVQCIYLHREVMKEQIISKSEILNSKAILRPENGTTEGRQISNPNDEKSKKARKRAVSKLAVDHIDRDSLNNKRENLRFATRSQNCMNVGKRKKVKSRYKGTYYSKREKMWRAEIRAYNNKISLGRYSDEVEAAKAYDKAAIQYHKEFACLNFPPRQKPRGLRGIIRNCWFKILNTRYARLS
ncbi:MAG: HNH endonuclease [Sedimentisphaerales bacterium]|nr:HNH endonuclease [Sedimentisphaerales bacterium]